MADPDLTTMLAELFENRWPAGRNPYALNEALHCKPWWEPLPVVWSRRGIGPPPWAASANGADCWAQALALLESLHEQYRAAREPQHRVISSTEVSQ